MDTDPIQKLVDEAKAWAMPRQWACTCNHGMRDTGDFCPHCGKEKVTPNGKVSLQLLSDAEHEPLTVDLEDLKKWVKS